MNHCAGAKDERGSSPKGRFKGAQEAGCHPVEDKTFTQVLSIMLNLFYVFFCIHMGSTHSKSVSMMKINIPKPILILIT